MTKGSYIRRRFISFIGITISLLTAIAPAMASQTSHAAGPDHSYIRMAYKTDRTVSDSIFFSDALSIVFPINKYDINIDDYPQLSEFLSNAKQIISSDKEAAPYIRIRSAASPEGPFGNNCQLAKNRANSLKAILSNNGIRLDDISIDLVNEDYELLRFNMHKANDSLCGKIDSIYRIYSSNIMILKDALLAEDNGSLWSYISQKYFPDLRATRFMIVIPCSNVDSLIPSQQQFLSHLSLASGDILPKPYPFMFGTSYFDFSDKSLPRRELLSIKTNLLQDLAYVPDYGFCPLWNLAVEYYPLHGHYTFGASLDFPWWQKDRKKHKYMQIRNYQLEVRRYFKGDGVFRGLYAQGYVNCGLFGIGFNAKKGWMGEGAGAGIGCGYVLPICKSQHWRIEFQAQAGVIFTKYDPYVYGCPVEQIEDGLYYYDYIGEADLFKKRQHRFTWFGPTRVGITITYDLLYRKRK